MLGAQLARTRVAWLPAAGARTFAATRAWPIPAPTPPFHVASRGGGAGVELPTTCVRAPHIRTRVAGKPARFSCARSLHARAAAYPVATHHNPSHAPTTPHIHPLTYPRQTSATRARPPHPAASLGMPSLVRNPAPAWTAPAVVNEEFTSISSADLKGK